MKQIEWPEFLFAWGRRIAAIGFIFLILLGNVWATMMITGEQIPVWLYDSGVIVTAVAVLGGFLMLISYLLRAVNLQK